MLALSAIDTTEITDLATIAGVRAFDVLQRAHVDWTVTKTPIYLPSGQVIPGNFANVRSDNGRPLGIVGNRYQIIQNQHGLDLFDACAAKGAIEYGKAGTFKGGAIVWLQAKLPNSLDIAGDEVGRYLLLANTHDGSGTLRILITPIRIACRNTLTMALRAANGITIRHTFAAQSKVQEAINIIEHANRFYDEFGVAARTLHRRQMTTGAMRDYAEKVFPIVGEALRPSARLEGTRDRVIDLFETGQGHFAIRGTAWAAYNAVAEYVDHHRATRGVEANRLESAWLGSGAEVKRRAFELAMSV
jgi:phage/plasmid-like protein (TIGR03299 family)